MPIGVGSILWTKDWPVTRTHSAPNNSHAAVPFFNPYTDRIDWLRPSQHRQEWRVGGLNGVRLFGCRIPLRFWRKVRVLTFPASSCSAPASQDFPLFRPHAI